MDYVFFLDRLFEFTPIIIHLTSTTEPDTQLEDFRMVLVAPLAKPHLFILSNNGSSQEFQIQPTDADTMESNVVIHVSRFDFDSIDGP